LSLVCVLGVLSAAENRDLLGWSDMPLANGVEMRVMRWQSS
jgi:hypothetical protein